MTGAGIPGFSGRQVSPRDPDYDAVREIWNAMHERRPAVIAQCGTVDDVSAAIRHGRSKGLPIAIRSGGHSYPGHGSCDDGLVIDLRGMNGVEVDPEKRRVRVQGGALLGDVDRATQEHGLVVPAGIVSHTGAAGLILGGGVGRLMRRYGLTIDSLVGVELVTADGDVVRADAETNPDLFWALHGGGGNFGVVTEFEFDLHEVGDVLVLGAFLPIAEAPRLLELAQETMPAAPDELWWVTMLRRAQPLPWMPDPLVGEFGAVTIVEWSGEHEEGRRVLNELRGRIDAAADSIDAFSYLTIQSLSDEQFGPGKRNYIKAGFLESLTPAAIEALISSAAEAGSDLSQVEVIAMGGAIARVPVAATAYPHRAPDWLINLPACWLHPSEDEGEIGWARGAYSRLKPLLTGGEYVNFIMDEDGGGEDRSAYGTTLERLRRVKAEWDPENVFRLNQNIEPAAVEGAA